MMTFSSKTVSAQSARKHAWILVVWGLVLAVVLSGFLAALPQSSAWANNDGTDTLMRVNDFSGSLTDDEEAKLAKLAKAEELAFKFDFVVYITEKSGDMATRAKNFYNENNCGYGQDDDGIILAIRPSDGASAVYVAGTGAVIFSDIDTANLAATATSELSYGVYTSVNNFLNRAVNKVAAYNGVDVSSRWPALTNAFASASSGTTTTAATAELDWYPADPKSFVDFHNENAPRVVDEADLLTPEEEANITAQLAEMKQRLGMDFVVVTNNSSYGLSRGVFAADYYQFNGYGVGDDYSGVIYYVCMEKGNRGFWTAARGGARTLLTEDNVNYMDDRTYDLFKSGDYGKAIQTQVNNLNVLYTNGEFPYDWSPIIGGICLSLIVGFIAGIVVGFRKLKEAKSMMKTVAKASYARDYVCTGPVFSVRTDRVTDVKVVRTKHVDTSSSSGGGGGRSSYSGSYHSSGGASFSGGGRSF